MGCALFPSLIQFGLMHECGKSFHAVPPSQGRREVTTTTTSTKADALWKKVFVEDERKDISGFYKIGNAVWERDMVSEGE